MDSLLNVLVSSVTSVEFAFSTNSFKELEKSYERVLRAIHESFNIIFCFSLAHILHAVTILAPRGLWLSSLSEISHVQSVGV